MVLGDGSIDDTLRKWFSSFTDYTSLLWRSRYGKPIPAYWVFQIPRWHDAQSSVNQGPGGLSWQTMSTGAKASDGKFLPVKEEGETDGMVKMEVVDANDANDTLTSNSILLKRRTLPWVRDTIDERSTRQFETPLDTGVFEECGCTWLHPSY